MEPEGTRGALQVFLRKRPRSEKEEQGRDYDALTVIPRKPYCNEVVLHNCQFQADLKTAFITHIHYGFDCVFPEDVSNEVVYAQTAQPLVQIAMNGGMATMFMFGQTGHGLVQRALFSFFPVPLLFVWGDCRSLQLDRTTDRIGQADCGF